MKKVLLFLFFSFSLLVSVSAQDMTVPMDSAVRKGVLPNGLTYYLRHNEWPEKRAFFYIAQKVGSIQEEDDQRGLAHFLEHMCFNGTTNFPGDRLKKYLETIGVKFGENLNAYTSFDETVYNIDNVNVETAGAIDSCLLILHDWSHDLLLEDAEIDKERGVINEEWRSRSSAMMRMYEKALPVMYPDSKYGDRLPIGTMDIVMNFPYDALRSYYRKWYRPDLQAIVIVGDINLDEMEQKIQKVFADIQPAAPDAAKFEYYPVPDNAESIFSINKDKEQRSNNIYFMWKTEAFPREMKDNVAYIIYNYFRGAMASMFSERISDILQKENAPFLGAGFSYGDYFVSKTKGAYSGSVTCDDNKYEQGVKALYREILRMKKYGFTASEYERYTSKYLSSLESAYLHRDKIQSGSYVEDCVRHFLDNEPLTSLEWDYTTMNQIVPATNVDMVNEMIQQIPIQQDNDSNFVVAMFAADKEDNILPTKEDFMKWMAEVEAEDIEPLKEEVNNEPLIAKMPKPGKVKKIKDDKYGAKLITLSNGIKVHVKKTDFSPNQISMMGHSWGGTSLYSLDESDQTENIGWVSVGGWGNFSATELSKKMAGKQASIGTGVGAESETVSGGCVKKDFETMLQLAYLHFTAPRKDIEAYNSAIQRSKANMKNAELQPTTALQDTIAKVVYNNHKLALRTKPEDLDKINYDRIIELYRERFADADDFEFFIVGDCDADTIAPLLAKYLGALPTKKGSESYKIIDLKMADGIITNVFEKHQETPSALVLFLYHTPMKYNLKNALTVSMLDQVMDMMYTESVREDEGGAYGVPVRGGLSRYPREEASIQIQLPTAPEKRAKMTEIVYQGVEKMVNEGPKAEDLQKVKEYMLRAHEEDLKKNGYWMGEMMNYVLYGEDNDAIYVDTLNSITASDIQEVARQIFRSGNRIEVGMTSPVE
ncbi:MAG: insulinase family protein [Bacteroidaceae bacterium]|nr:insulinase family protein [Bacteroidaceae bacterium]